MASMKAKPEHPTDLAEIIKSATDSKLEMVSATSTKNTQEITLSGDRNNHMVDENRRKSMARSFAASDAGCYVDSNRGIYATDAIIEFANDHGADITHDPGCPSIDCAATTIDATFATCEWVGEYEDRADDWMNDHYPVVAHYWGRQDGDWGLWQLDNDDDRRHLER